MVNENNHFAFPVKILFGFLAGYFSTMIFHQLVVAILWGIGLVPFKPYSMDATSPFGVPTVISLSFWGGIWGILYMLIHNRFIAIANYWLISFLFGGILPPLVGLLIVFPLKGHPIGTGLTLIFLLLIFIINGVWGIGTGFFIKALSAMFSKLKV